LIGDTFITYLTQINRLYRILLIHTVITKWYIRKVLVDRVALAYCYAVLRIGMQFRNNLLCKSMQNGCPVFTLMVHCLDGKTNTLRMNWLPFHWIDKSSCNHFLLTFINLLIDNVAIIKYWKKRYKIIFNFLVRKQFEINF